MKTAEDRTRQIVSLHKKYAGVIYDLSVRILKDSSEAEDAVQETFLNAFRALDSFSYGDNHLPWLYRIGTNVCLKMIRSKSRKGVTLLDNMATVEDATKTDASDRLSLRTRLAQLQHSLDDRNMEIVVSHYALGMNQQEIAELLGISRRAVVKRLARLKPLLRTDDLCLPEVDTLPAEPQNA